MEVIATKRETELVAKKHNGEDFIVFPEDRMHPIKMENDLLFRWVNKGSSNSFIGNAGRGENYAFQLGVYALKNLKNLTVGFGDLKSTNGAVISAKYMNCLNTDGITYHNKPLAKNLGVTKENF